jgi:TPR repeat protein
MALLEKAAGQGHVYAMIRLGSVHRERNEYEQAMKWATKGADAGLPQAMCVLGRGLHSFTSQPNVRAFCGIRGAWRGYGGVFAGCQGVLGDI